MSSAPLSCEHKREHRTVWLLLHCVPPQLQRKFPGSSEINTALRPLIKLTPYVASRHGTDNMVQIPGDCTLHIGLRIMLP